MTNRVDELESQVAKLQATVDGLTEELVETKERVRLLVTSLKVLFDVPEVVLVVVVQQVRRKSAASVPFR